MYQSGELIKNTQVDKAGVHWENINSISHVKFLLWFKCLKIAAMPSFAEQGPT